MTSSPPQQWRRNIESFWNVFGPKKRLTGQQNSEHNSLIEESTYGEWTRSNRNRFIGDATARWSPSEAVKMAAESFCTWQLEGECGDQCLNRIMQYECDKNSCRLGEARRNRAFATLRGQVEANFDPGIEICETRTKCYGLRTKGTFKQHEIIIEYTGEIITREQSRSRHSCTGKADQVSLGLPLLLALSNHLVCSSFIC